MASIRRTTGPGSSDAAPWWTPIAATLYGGLNLLVYGAVLAGFLFRSRTVAAVAVVALAAVFALHLTVSALEYRRVMRREWPKVEPLEDDDD